MENGRLNQLMQTTQSPLPTNVGAHNNNMFVGWIGQGSDQFGKYEAEPYHYTLEFDVTGGLAFTGSGNIQIQANAAFLLTETTYTLFDTTAGAVTRTDELTAEPFGVQLTDSGSGRNITNGNAKVTNLFGTAQRPFYWTTPKYFAASSVLRIALTTGAVVPSANDLALTLTFSGEQRYYY
jgi:hypothetical protein